MAILFSSEETEEKKQGGLSAKEYKKKEVVGDVYKQNCSYSALPSFPYRLMSMGIF